MSGVGVAACLLVTALVAEVWHEVLDRGACRVARDVLRFPVSRPPLTPVPL